MKAVIIAAWFGTRMLPVTKTVAKEMLPVGTKPVIQYTMDALSQAGIQEMLFVTSHYKKALEDYVDAHYELEDLFVKKQKPEFLEMINHPKTMAHYAFVRQHQTLGTAHAVKQVAPWISDDYFFVIFPDAIYHPDLFSLMVQQHKETWSAIIAAHEVPREDVNKYGVIAMDGDRMTHIVEWPKVEEAPSNLICNGVYLLPKRIFQLIDQVKIDEKRGEYLLPDAINLLAQETSVLIHKTAPFWDIGNEKWFLAANAKLYTDGCLF